MSKNKIALGTAQFGMNYGINNKSGKIPQEGVFEILNRSLEFGIDTLDTAYGYGDCESVIGDYIRNNRKKFRIVSKLPKCKFEDVKNIFNASLIHLGVDSLYGYLVHSFQQYQEDIKIWDIIGKLKSEGKIQKIGFSLYHPYELEYLLENKIDIDIIQVSYSIFDRRFESYFLELKKRGVEIHVRSVFLQGLVFMNPSELNGQFIKIKDKIADLNSLSTKLNISRVALCLNFAIINRFTDKVVIGVDSIDNLEDIFLSLDYSSDVKNVLNELSGFREDDEDIILPINWKVKTP